MWRSRNDALTSESVSRLRDDAQVLRWKSSDGRSATDWKVALDVRKPPRQVAGGTSPSPTGWGEKAGWIAWIQYSVPRGCQGKASQATLEYDVDTHHMLTRSLTPNRCSVLH